MNLDSVLNHSENIGKVRDQGPYPTCLAHSASTVHRNVQELNEPLSAETLHYHATEANWSVGSTMDEIQEALERNGQPKDRHCDPLPDKNPGEWSPPEEAPIYRSKSDQKSASPPVVKDVIRRSTLPILGISLPERFYNPEPPWIISAGQPQGRHAVVGLGIAKYEDETVVRIRNSWGKGWADSGHAWLDNSFLREHLQEVLILTRGVNT